MKSLEELRDDVNARFLEFEKTDSGSDGELAALLLLALACIRMAKGAVR